MKSIGWGGGVRIGIFRMAKYRLSHYRKWGNTAGEKRRVNEARMMRGNEGERRTANR